MMFATCGILCVGKVLVDSDLHISLHNRLQHNVYKQTLDPRYYIILLQLICLMLKLILEKREIWTRQIEADYESSSISATVYNYNSLSTYSSPDPVLEM